MSETAMQPVIPTGWGPAGRPSGLYCIGHKMNLCAISHITGANMVSVVVRSPPQIGQTLRRARHAAGLTQSEVAAKAGTTQPTLSALENGNRNARLCTLTDVLAALGLELAIQDRTPAALEDVVDLL